MLPRKQLMQRDCGLLLGGWYLGLLPQRLQSNRGSERMLCIGPSRLDRSRGRALARRCSTTLSQLPPGAGMDSKEVGRQQRR